MKTLIFSLLFIAAPVSAEVYLDIGLALHSNSYDNANHPENKSTINMDNPLGIIEAGFNHGNITFFFEHISSISNKDKGFNMIGIKYRLK